jgi:serine/threonine protein kinase
MARIAQVVVAGLGDQIAKRGKCCQDQEHLAPAERLALFIPVCNAVQHAHQKGIIHRDLKPSNVLIALYDGKPVPKVIDFGVAKATQQKLTERTMFTEVGQIVGALEYMVPEQAELNNLDIDTPPAN